MSIYNQQITCGNAACRNHSLTMKNCIQDFPMEGQQKEIQYPGWHKDTTGRGFESGEYDEVP